MASAPPFEMAPRAFANSTFPFDPDRTLSHTLCNSQLSPQLSVGHIPNRKVPCLALDRKVRGAQCHPDFAWQGGLYMLHYGSRLLPIGMPSVILLGTRTPWQSYLHEDGTRNKKWQSGDQARRRRPTVGPTPRGMSLGTRAESWATGLAIRVSSITPGGFSGCGRGSPARLDRALRRGGIFRRCLVLRCREGRGGRPGDWRRGSR